MLFSTVTALAFTFGTLSYAPQPPTHDELLALFTGVDAELDVKENLGNDYKAIKKPVRKFLKKHPKIDEFEASCPSFEACEGYYYVDKKYELNYTPEQIFSTLCEVSPQELWEGKAAFQLSYVPEENHLYTLLDDAPMVQEDMIIALNLKVLGLTSIPVVFKIITVNRDENHLEFSYVQENKNHGIQSVRIYATETGSVVHHESKYFSGKNFRDKKLYPWIHHKLTDSFYENLETLIEAKFGHQ